MELTDEILRVCERTPAVRDEIMGQVGKANCADFTKTDITSIQNDD